MAGEDQLSDIKAAFVDAVRPTLAQGSPVVALSGGADSAIAAWALTQAAQGSSSGVRAVHVHHGLAPSDLLEKAARNIAEALGIALAVVSIEVPSGPSPEGQARNARHRALEETLGAGELIVTGHTRDDQGETVLGNLVRGAGTGGLSGIPARRGRWRRPLLSFSREQIRNLADALSLPYYDDPANTDMRHMRNRLRHDLIPHLEENFNPRLRETLSRTASSLREDDAALERLAADVPVAEDEGAILVPTAALTSLHLAVAARIARRALRLLHPPYAGTASDVTAMLNVAGEKQARTAIGGGYLAEREGPYVALYPEERLHPMGRELPESVTLTAPGEVPFGNRLLHASVADGVRPLFLGPARAVFDRDALGDSLTVRTAEEGERIELGGGNKLVREAMAEGGVPLRKRLTWPVVTAHGKIAWLVGIRKASWALPDGETTRFTVLDGRETIVDGMTL